MFYTPDTTILIQHSYNKMLTSLAHYLESENQLFRVNLFYTKLWMKQNTYDILYTINYSS